MKNLTLYMLFLLLLFPVANAVPAAAESVTEFLAEKVVATVATGN